MPAPAATMTQPSSLPVGSASTGSYPVLLLQGGVHCRQFFLRQFLEVDDHIFQLMPNDSVRAT